MRLIRTQARNVFRRWSSSKAAATPSSEPILTVADCVYGNKPIKPPGKVIFENKDGHRIEDGRYKQFINLIKRDGISTSRIYTDEIRTFAYGTDASFYRMIPKVVVKANSEDEVRIILRHARKCETPVTFRAAGTSLSGQAVTDSILVKISHTGKNWRSYKISDDASTIKVGPGLIGGEVNTILQKYCKKHNIMQKKLGPDPASIDSCMIGGIVNNNSSGMCCGVAKNTYNTIQDLELIMADGTRLDTSCQDSVNSFKVTHRDLLSGISEIRSTIKENKLLKETIERKFKIKCTTGYAINAFVDYDDPLQILKHIIIGSEGTLAFVCSATYTTVPEYPQKASAFLMFDSQYAACEVAIILKTKQSAVSAAELFDRASLREGEKSDKFLKLVPAVENCDESCAGILLEVRSTTEAELTSDIKHISEMLLENGAKTLDGKITFHTEKEDYESLWDMRRGLIPKVGGSRRVGTSVLIEDVACPIESLADMTIDLLAMFKTHGYNDACIFGHALDGNLHLLFSQGFSTQQELDQYNSMMESLAQIVAVRYRGSLKAEHGTGRNVASFVELEWGSAAYSMMWDVKRLFDPEMLLNPGVLLNEDCNIHKKNLKVMPAANTIIDRCIECGFCESNCPSKDITLTPRQRITVYREIARLHASSDPDDKIKASELVKSYIDVAEKSCAADGMCEEKCPVSINTGELMKYIRASEIEEGSKSEKLSLLMANNFSLTAASMRAVLATAKAASCVLGKKNVSRLSQFATSVTGLNGVIPQYTPYLPGPAKSIKLSDVTNTESDGETREVIFFPSCVCRIMDTKTPTAITELIKRAGYSIKSLPHTNSMCCGMMFDSKGYQQAADACEGKLILQLKELSQDGKIPIVCENSPCAKQLRDAGRVVGIEVYDPISFIYLNRKKFQWTVTKDAIAIHVPCSSKKSKNTTLFQHLASLCSETVVDSGIPCCGTAGDRGLRFPELPASAINNLADDAVGLPSYSTSTTCEIGLSTHTGTQWEPFITLIEESTRPAINRRELKKKELKIISRLVLRSGPSSCLLRPRRFCTSEPKQQKGSVVIEDRDITLSSANNKLSALGSEDGHDGSSVRTKFTTLEQKSSGVRVVLTASHEAIGGKGGFGQILRAKGKNSTQQTTNFDSCRTLNGPRVGIQRQLKAIELWGKGEDNADELTRLAVGSIAAAKAHRDSRSRRGYETKELSAKEKAELREQQVREGFEDQLKETSRRVSGTLKALSAGLKKKHEHGISYCLEGHPLQSVLVGLGKNETGFDWNACDECDEICEQQVHRCAICDFDICCACRDALVKEASQVDTVQPKKKKKKKSSAFDHGLSEDSSNESDD